MKTYELKNILVAIDFSEISMNALETAISLSRKHGASIIITHVIENTRFLYSPAGGLAAIALLPELTRTAEERLSDVATQIRNKYNLHVFQSVLTGHPAEAICQEAFRRQVDLVIIGSHGTSGLKELLIGSTAYFVVRSCTAPVLTVPGNNRWLDFRKILFPVRADSHSYDKYEFVRSIVHKEGSSILLAGISDKSKPSSHLQVESLMEDIHRMMTNENVITAGQFYECKNMAAQVLDIANCEKPDLIVITTTTENTVWDFFTVAYPQGIVNHSQFPVLSIRPMIEVDAQVKAVQYIDNRLSSPTIAFG